MNSSVTSQPQPLYQISPPGHVGAISIEVLSYILLGLGGILPVVFLLGVALALRCYRRHKEAQLDRWRSHIRQDRFLTDRAKGGHAKRSKTQLDFDNLSFSLPESDLGLEPYYGAITSRGGNLNDPVDYVYTRELKRSITNSNVYFKNDGKKSKGAEVDSAIADSEPGSSVTDHQSNASSSSTVDYHRIQESIGHVTSADSGRGSGDHRTPPQDHVAGRRVSHPPGVIMGVNRLMDSTGRSVDRANRNVVVSSAIPTNSTQPTKRSAPSPPSSRLIHPTIPKEDGREERRTVEEKRQTLGNEEEQVLRYFDDIHSDYLPFEADNSTIIGGERNVTSSSLRRNSIFHTTRL